MTCSSLSLLSVLVALLSTACIGAPDVLIVDRKTALEQQAAGSFRGLEEEIEQAGLSPRPAPLTTGEMGGAGTGALAADPTAAGAPDALAVDTLLVQRCIGEARDATLVLTRDQCTGTIDVGGVNRLLERQNRNRRQLWQWLAGKQPGSTESDIRTTWRKVHLEGLVCGGHLQADSGAWETKRC